MEVFFSDCFYKYEVVSTVKYILPYILRNHGINYRLQAVIAIKMIYIIIIESNYFLFVQYYLMGKYQGMGTVSNMHMFRPFLIVLQSPYHRF